MTAVGRLKRKPFAVCGSINGDLYVFNYNSLFVDRAVLVDFNVTKLKKIDMAVTRNFSAHTAMVS